VAQAENRIDTRTANSMTWNQQVCLINLARKPLIESTPTAAPTRSRSRDTSSDDSSVTTWSDPSTSAASTTVSRPVHRVILTPDGDEIAPPVEILEDNEAEPIHHKGCSCLECAEKYRNQPPEEHHPNCQCGLCEEQEQGIGLREPGAEPSSDNDVILSEVWRLAPNEVEGPAFTDQNEASTASGESRDLLLAEPGKIEGAPSLAQPRVGSKSSELPISSLAQQGPVEALGFSPANQACPQVRGPHGQVFVRVLEDRTLLPPAGAQPSGEANCRRPRIARASALLSGSPSRDPLNRPWSVAEYTFGDAIRRHEAQYAARAAAALAVGIEPPPYEPFTTGLIPSGHPDYEEDQQMQQHSSEYWAAHFRKLIAERPDIQQYLEEEKQYLEEEDVAESAPDTKNSQLETEDFKLTTES
jgi:hypothetical protein